MIGLALALDVLGAASGLGAAGQWGRIGSGVAFALTAAATFGVALVLTQQEAGDVDGRVRTLTTMSMVGLFALTGVAVQGGFRLPQASVGWWGLAALTFLYGTAFTIMFTMLPKLGVVGNSAIMNVEPVFALVLAWLILGQAIAPVQVAGALLVVGAGLAQTPMDRAAPDIKPLLPNHHRHALRQRAHQFIAYRACSQRDLINWQYRATRSLSP